jgi:hypothetical protein
MVGFQELGNSLVRYAEHAHAFRQVELVRETAEMLCGLPLKQYQTIGQYYLAWCDRKNGDTAVSSLESLADTAPAKYRARAMHVLATIAARKEDNEAEFRWLTESLRLYPSVEGFRGLAVLKAREGFHVSALKGLENLVPIIRHAESLEYYDFLNSYAFELGEAGRRDEARNVSRLVLASPFAYAYPEWQETAEELKPPNRSFVVPDPSPPHMGKLLSMPVVEQAKPQRLDRPARIINFQQWKKKMGKDDDDRYGLTPEQLKEMSPSEKLCYILNSINPDFTDEDFDRVIDLVDEINDKKKK